MDINAIEPIAIGVLLLVVLLWRPKGLVKERPTLTMKKSKLQSIYDKANKALKQENAPLPPQSDEADDETVPKTPEGWMIPPIRKRNSAHHISL